METRTEQHQTRIRLCGHMLVESRGREIRPAGRQGAELLAYLVANRSRPVRRDELIDVLWPDRPPADPRRDLNTLLSRLRKSLGEGITLSRGHGDVSVLLPSDAWVDIEDIKELSQGALQALEDDRPDEAIQRAGRALRLMEHELLSDCESKWIDEGRRELGELRVSVREALVRASLRRGSRAGLWLAKSAAEALVREAPYRESGYELLMRVHATMGDVPEANRVYHELRALLRDELGIPPGPRITKLNEHLLARGETSEAAPAATDEAPTAPSAAARVPLPPELGSAPDEHFVGREQLLAGLSARWHKTSFRPRVVMLTGEAGIGKTRLAACFSRRVHRSQGTVLYGRCDRDPLTSYQPFVEALDAYASVRDFVRDLPDEVGELRRLPGLRRRLHADQSPSAMPQDRYPLFEAIAAVFRHAARAEPLLLVVDDVQWADRPTRKLMLYLVRTLEPSRTMFLLTFRDPPVGERSDDPENLLEARLNELRGAAPELERFDLQGLDEKETGDLIEEWRGRPIAGDFARDLQGRTGGNPFFIREALRSLDQRGELGAADKPDVGRLGVPERAKEVINLRIARLTAPARQVIACASVIGPEFSRSLVAAVVDLPSAAILDALTELVHDRLIIQLPNTEQPNREGRFTFAHALVREAQYGDLIDGKKRWLHALVAQELERRAQRVDGTTDKPAAAELAYHFYQAGSEVDPERTVRYLVEAASHAERGGAYEEAITHYDRALELAAGTSDEAQVCKLLLSRGKALVRAPRRKKLARETFARAAEIARRLGDADLLARAALGFHGRYTAAAQVDNERIELLEEARAALDPRDSPLRARVLARLSDSLMWVDHERAVELSGEAVEMARRLGHTSAILESLGGRHAALLYAADLDQRLEVGRERLEVATAAGSPEATAAALRSRIHDLCESGDVRSAKAQFARLTELARDLRQPLYLSYAYHWACVFAQLHGRLAEAERLADEAFELALQAEAEDAEMSRLDKRVSIYREQGLLREETRRAELRRSVEGFAVRVPEIPAWYAVLAFIQAEGGAQEEARAHVDRLLADDAAAIPRDVFWLYALALLGETCVRLNDAGASAAVIYRLLAPYANQCIQVGMDSFWGSVHRFLGLAATTCEDWQAADHAFREAERRHRQIASRPLLARTQLSHAEMLLRRNGPAARSEASPKLLQARKAARDLDLVDIRKRAEELGAGRAALV